MPPAYLELVEPLGRASATARRDAHELFRRACFNAFISNTHDSGDVSPLELRARARRLKQHHPALSLLVVDYLQLMRVRVRGRGESRQFEVAELSRSLKQLAKELELPILALAQLNRRVEERRGPPMLSDLRESGAIEQDADVVLHRERVDEDKGDRGFAGGGGRGDRGDRGERDAGVAGAAAGAELIPVEVHVAKQRNGPTGEAQLLFQGAYTRFESVRRGGA